MNRKEDTVFCYYAHNSVWTCELGYGADTMFHRTYLLFKIHHLHKYSPIVVFQLIMNVVDSCRQSNIA